MDGKLIQLTDIIESRAGKEAELQRYRKDLEELQTKISKLEFDCSVIKIIIDMIEQDKVATLLPSPNRG